MRRLAPLHLKYPQSPESAWWEREGWASVLHRLRRHPFAVRAHFDHCLVLTYAVPADVLQPLLPRGLTVDRLGDDGFLAVALVQTRDLRPAGLPRWVGRDFFLSGYRVFTRMRDGGRTLRGLRILRSDTDKAAMRVMGNLLTHYKYRPCRAKVREHDGFLGVDVTTPSGEADLSVRARLSPATAPPAGSPFRDLREARKFAGPLPFTFDSEPETDSMVVIEGVRPSWDPMPVEVTVERCTFLEREPFSSAGCRLANAFYVPDVEYMWKPGRLVPVPAETVAA